MLVLDKAAQRQRKKKKMQIKHTKKKNDSWSRLMNDYEEKKMSANEIEDRDFC
jgi:hypothetical protein